MDRAWCMIASSFRLARGVLVYLFSFASLTCLSLRPFRGILMAVRCRGVWLLQSRIEISRPVLPSPIALVPFEHQHSPSKPVARQSILGSRRDRKSTRLNSSHVRISYAVF